MSSFQQVADFQAECDSLAEVLEPLSDDDFERATLFKEWTLHDVVAHLHIFNYAADASIHDLSAFEGFKQFMAARRGRLTLRELTDEWFEGKRNRVVYDVWREYYPRMCDRLDGVDPKQRAEWFGPSMSVRSLITARQMETWAHGQEVFDVLGLDRVEADRIKNIVFLGLNTFGWTYAVRGLRPPDVVPCLRLAAPSGENWTWNADEAANRITGTAVDFAQVVTQVRNVADTSLEVVGTHRHRVDGHGAVFRGRARDATGPGCTAQGHGLTRQNYRRPGLRAGCGQDARVPSVRPMTGARSGSRVARVAPHGFPGQIVLPRKFLDRHLRRGLRRGSRGACRPLRAAPSLRP